MRCCYSLKKTRGRRGCSCMWHALLEARRRHQLVFFLLPRRRGRRRVLQHLHTHTHLRSAVSETQLPGGRDRHSLRRAAAPQKMPSFFSLTTPPSTKPKTQRHTREKGIHARAASSCRRRRCLSHPEVPLQCVEGRRVEAKGRVLAARAVRSFDAAHEVVLFGSWGKRGGGGVSLKRVQI